MLLIGSVNVASLVLVRASARLREFATRIAVGASRWQIGRQLVTEHLLLTGLSAAGGLAMGVAALRAVMASNVLQLPRAREIRFDWLVGLDALAVAAGIGVVLGLIPIAHLTRINLAATLTESSRTATGGRRARLTRRAFVVLQVAFAFVLLIGAGLLLTSFRRVLAIDPGFNPDRVLTAEISLPGSRYASEASFIGFANDALLRLRALPGVTGAGVTDTIPFGGNLGDSVIFAEGYQMQPGESIDLTEPGRGLRGIFRGDGCDACSRSIIRRARQHHGRQDAHRRRDACPPLLAGSGSRRPSNVSPD